MPCPALTTGSQFLSGMMSHIDCQSRGLGAYGYGALADRSSAAFAVTTALLAVFIALHGIRLLFDGHDYPQRLVNDIVKIGIVLTLATSWPAWRIIGYDLVLDGPLEVAQSVGIASGTTPTARYDQLQALDDNLVVMTAYGTGRLAGGGVQQGDEPGDSFQGIALADQFALGWGRSAFLIGSIVPFGISRLGAGLLLALTPLVAGLYLFGATIGLFTGWVRGLAFCAVGSFTQYLMQAIEVGLIMPWAQDVIAGREGGALTPSAPTELLVMTMSFTIINLGLLFVCAKVAFFPGAKLASLFHREGSPVATEQSERRPIAGRAQPVPASRAQLVAESVSTSMRQEAVTTRRHLIGGAMAGGMTGSISPGAARGNDRASNGQSGLNAKRTVGRRLASTQRRDLR
ncbi:type IV secretion system protein [Sphingomonas sp. CGMCC 1.13654]|uniref:Type IV secretion system protein n=1 Tax=Sphingomonas chungangi TaxID=2683589 RepID=A0A838KZB7_9SPHN|nr:type IV secretion system protein [Sphingomonas chungangi]MBA2932603.1 type IV secretion system protein [Sphingomonas chungangi]MVW56226.1 conjugal transfer protein TrbL [Sphingomonas chungangi]